MPFILKKTAGFVPYTPQRFAARYAGPVFSSADPPSDPTPAAAPPAAPADPTRSDADWAKLMKESAGHRANALSAAQKLAEEEQRRTAAEAERDRLKAEKDASDAAKAAVENQVKTIRTDSSLEVAAIRAGILDLDALKLVDRAGLELNEDGSLKDGAAAMAKLKEAKPYLFGTPGATPPATPPANTGNPTPPPPPATPGKNKVADMSPEEFRQAVKAKAWNA